SHSSTRMRTLERWSLSSLSITTPSPFKAEPSRRMAFSLLGMLLEIALVDRLQARLLDRETKEPAARANHRGGRFRPYVALGQEQPSGRGQALHPLHPRHCCKILGEAL